MPSLARGDEGRILRFVAEAESFGGTHPFEGEFLTQLAKLVPAGWLGYIHGPGGPGEEPSVFVRPGDEDAYAFLQTSNEARAVNLTMPTFAHLERNYGVVKLSDFLRGRSLHQTELYSVVLGPEACEDSLSVRLPVPGMAQFVFDRDTEFRERDRAVVETLIPHLVRLHRSHEVRRRLDAALAMHESSGAGVVLLEADGGVAFATAAASALLERWFGRNGSVPSEPLRSWIAERRRGAAGPLRVERGGRALVVEHADDALLLEERRLVPGLTPRERELLELVADGKSNAEIAEQLWISAGTVRKHLDNVYAKLGVHSRTAAAAFLRDV
jgi:DNA-binding CsgD family transcriptional regulator